MARTADAAPTTGCASCHAEVPADAGFCPRCGASRAPGRAPAPVLPGYTILRMLGQGGAAVVYLARQEALDRDVAVKVLRRHVDDPKAWRDFRREARTIARLSGHPNVVTVYTAGRSEAGQPYLVTEYLDRGSLADVIAAEGPGPPHVVAKVGVAVADALEAAHALGILHRDVKPGNVLLDHDGRVKLGDFGIARLLAGQGITTTDTVAFTPEHVAPEILRSEREGPWSDLYGLASTLAAALVGESIFRQQPGERMEALLTRKLMSPPPPLPASVPASLAEPIAHALDPDPARRPSLGELRAQLAAAAESLGAEGAAPAATTVRAAVPIAVPAGGDDDLRAAHDQDRDVAPVAGPPLLGELHRSRRGWLAIPAVLLAIIVAVLGARLLDGGGEGTAADTTTVTAPTVSASPAATSPTAAPATVPPTTVPPATLPSTSVASAPPPATAAAPAAAAPAPVVTAPPATAAPRPAATAPPPAPPAAAPVDAGPDLVDQPTAENFVRDYYDAVEAGDYETSWAQLAPEFQRGKAVSYEYYTDFWDDNDIAVGDVRLVDATATEALVNVQLFWNDSATSVTDQFTLRRGDAGELLIAAQRGTGG